jgi:hypothetical protein
MANELKIAVGESNEHTLSLGLAKKVDRVEKLSKFIRDRIAAVFALKQQRGRPGRTPFATTSFNLEVNVD